MSYDVYKVMVRGELVGWTVYSNTSDMWLCDVTDEPPRSRPFPSSGCEAHPRRGDLRPAHQFVWATLTDADDYGCGRLLYCPQCRAIVPPPYDERREHYADEYPAAWIAGVQP